MKYKGAQLESKGLIKYILSSRRGDDELHEILNNAIMGAALSGNFDIVIYLIDKGGNIEYGLYGAALSGNEGMFHFLLNKIDNVEDPNFLFDFAVDGGNINIMNLINNKYVLTPYIFQLQLSKPDIYVSQSIKNYITDNFIQHN